jgi:hypothetical protein
MGLIQARSTRIRLRGYPDRVPGKAEDHWAAVRVRDKAVRQAKVVVRVQVEGAHPVEVAFQVVAAVLQAVALLAAEQVAVPDLVADQARVQAEAVVVPEREAVAATDNTMKKMLFVMQTRR